MDATLRLEYDFAVKAIAAGPLRIDCAKRKAYINGETVALAPKEFDILLLLARDMGKEFTAEEIYSEVWGGGSFCGRSVIVHISSIRKKLGIHDESTVRIVTRRRKYYSLRAG